MPDDVQVEQCPETGICSIVKKDGTKVDLMPFEVDMLRDAKADPEAVKKALKDNDAGFADALSADDVAEIAGKIE